MDRLTPEARSHNMSRVRPMNTGPERYVRSFLHRAGLRFRCHVSRLPGCPDIVLSKYRTVVFVHGCFWHQHPGCRRARMPTTNSRFWKLKLSKNIARDRVVRQALRRAGWHVHVIWSCELRRSRRLTLLTKEIRLHGGSDETRDAGPSRAEKATAVSTLRSAENRVKLPP